MCYKLCHILKWKHYFIKLLDESVTTLDVLLPDIHAIDNGVTWLTVNLSIEEEVDVRVLEMVVVDEVLNEMHHWSTGQAVHQDYILAVSESCPK